MKKIILLLICICSCTALCHGQSAKIDSLLQVLKTSKEDTARVNTLKWLANEYLYNDPDTASYFADEAHALAIKLNYNKGIMAAKLLISNININLGKYDDAMNTSIDLIKLCDRLIPLATGNEKTGDKQKILMTKAAACNIIGRMYALRGNYPEALKNYSIFLKISEETGFKRGIAAAYENIGIINYNLGNYPEALKNQFSSLKISEEIDDKQGMARTYNNMGSIYDVQGNFSDALKIYFTSLKISEELGDKQLVSYSYRNIGLIYRKQGRYDEALKTYHHSLSITEETGDKYGIAFCYHNIGNCFLFQNKYTEALKNYLASLKISEELGDKDGIARSYINIGYLYTQLKQYKEASYYLNKGLLLAKEIGNLESIHECYGGLAELDSTLENYKSSLEHYKLYIAARDSLVNQDNTNKITQLQMQYEFDKKEALAKHEQDEKDALALKELQRQKLIRDFALGTIGLVLVLFFFIYRSYRARQALRLNDIRNRIAGDLHDDIGSTLNSISIYSEVARKKDEHYDEALEMIGDASRKIIEAMSDIVWTINAENDSFEKIIFRMKSLAFNLFRAKKIEFTFHADEILNEKKLSLEERRNFYLIFKEAINNLVKYASATRAAITLTYENNKIRLRIQDNGVGFDTSQQNAGNGLKNMKRRADEMKAGFKIESQPGSGTQIELILKV
jgi:two-component system, NarL family, sensor histidine kinase UhpB